MIAWRRPRSRDATRCADPACEFAEGGRRCWLEALAACRECLGDVDPCEGFCALRLERALDAMIDAERRLSSEERVA